MLSPTSYTEEHKVFEALMCGAEETNTLDRVWESLIVLLDSIGLIPNARLVVSV